MKGEKTKNKKIEIYDDVWIPTQCHRCQAECGILAHRVNGVVVKLEGNPDSAIGSRGGLCPKGLAGVQLLYDPNRLNAPLKRTNPEKGIGVDPKWQEITWDEALEEIAGRLKKVMEEDPSKIMLQIGISSSTMIVPLFLAKLMMALSTKKGSPLPIISGGSHCGNAGHFINAVNYAAFVTQPDWKYCNYVLQWGTNFGEGGFMQYANRLAAEARERGMKLVVFDPVCNIAASKADEWVPLLPGTDAAVALGLLNVIVNELGIYDAEYLKKKTNASYLVGEDGHYLRDKTTHKPLVWDVKDSKAKVFNDPSISDFDLDETHKVNGLKCRPAWQLLKEHFKKYTPEKVAEISGVSANAIRRIAKEFAEAAMVGATITIDGKQLPYRPVAIQHIRAAVTHGNGTQNTFALDLLVHVLGAANVPGGMQSVSVECHGYPGSGLPHLEVVPDADGFVSVGGKWLFPENRLWPVVPPEYPHHDLIELFTSALEVPLWGGADREELLRKARISSQIDVILNFCTNGVFNSANPRDKAAFLKTVPFIVDIDIFPNEFNEGFADIVLPDASYLEYTDWSGIQHMYHNQPPVLDEPWCFHITQKVVEPQYQRRHAAQVIDDLLYRMGMYEKVIGYYNGFLCLPEELQLPHGKKIVWEDLCDRVARQHFGDEHGWEWFKKHGFISWPKKVEEQYWRPFKDIRSQVYWEFMIDHGRNVKAISQELGIEMDWQQYSPLPDWFPCAPHKVTDPDYDLYAFCYREPTHVGSVTMEQPWIDEASAMNPYTYNIALSTETARKKGLKPGDFIEVESSRGNKVHGRLEVRKGQHPQTLTIMGTAGHWAKGQPIARGKGVNFNSLMEMRYSECDPISFSLEVLVKVKLKKVK